MFERSLEMSFHVLVVDMAENEAITKAIMMGLIHFCCYNIVPQKLFFLWLHVQKCKVKWPHLGMMLLEDVQSSDHH